jgi:hypothetical protein
MKVLLRLDEQDVDFLLALIARNERDNEVKEKRQMITAKEALQQAVKLKEWNKKAENE